MDVRASISAALELRSAQRPSIDKLSDAWVELGEALDLLLSSAGAFGGDWPLDDIRELRTKISAGTPEMAAIRARFHRDTVNIGVIGRPKAGKSTLLRTITGLGDDALPTSRDNPTTAARSRIQHEPGRADAKVTLYSWQEFRDHYVRPLHEKGGCPDAVPASAADFLAYPYHRLLDSSQGQGRDREIYKQQFLDRLCVAQDSFDSYRGYLTGAERALTIRNLADLRPFVAYPRDRDDHRRPYHAVRDVWIYCQFRVGEVERLVLVDLPGAGEAALDIDEQFLAGLRNQVDVLMQVKLPAMTEAYVGELDWDVLGLADAARMGVDHADFLTFVINTYPDKVPPDVVNNLRRDAQRIADRNGVQLRAGDVSNPDDVRVKILGPVLEHLALRLAAMDRQAAQTQIDRALAVADLASGAVARIGAEVSSQERQIPDEQQALRRAANELRAVVGHQMNKLRADYDRRAREQEPVQELNAAIAQARERLLKWADGGFGKGSKREWLTTVERFMTIDPGETRDDQCTLARQRIRAEFGEIDSSIAGAIDRLHLEVAKVLRDGLTGRLVPDDGRPLDALRDTASGLSTLHAALDELIEVRAGYGSVFLRVGGPVVRHIRPVAGTIGGAADGSGDSPDRAGRRAGGVAEKFYEGARRTASTAGASHIGALGAAATAHPAAAAAIHVAAAAPLIADWISRVQVQVTDESAAGLHEGLTRAFREAVTVIEERMLDEASQLTQVLAAAMDQFFDSFARTPDVQEEWAVLCEPVRAEKWPDIFGSGAADLAARLGQLAETVSRAGTAAGEIRAAAAGMGLSDARR
jgi:hypothetical protein